MLECRLRALPLTQFHGVANAISRRLDVYKSLREKGWDVPSYTNSPY